MARSTENILASGLLSSSDIPSFTSSNLPSASSFGIGLAIIDGVPWYSNGATWVKINKSDIENFHHVFAWEVLRKSNAYGGDQRALSSSSVIDFCPSSRAKSVYLSSINNGASGTARIRVAVNCRNEAHGLFMCNSTEHRDTDFLIGSHVLINIVDDDYIGIIHVNASESIAANTHYLQVEWR